MIEPTPKELARETVVAREDRRDGRDYLIVDLAGIEVFHHSQTRVSEELAKWLRVGLRKFIEEQEQKFTERLQRELRNERERMMSEA